LADLFQGLMSESLAFSQQSLAFPPGTADVGEAETVEIISPAVAAVMFHEVQLEVAEFVEVPFAVSCYGYFLIDSGSFRMVSGPAGEQGFELSFSEQAVDGGRTDLPGQKDKLGGWLDLAETDQALEFVGEQGFQPLSAGIIEDFPELAQRRFQRQVFGPAFFSGRLRLLTPAELSDGVFAVLSGVAAIFRPRGWFFAFWERYSNRAWLKEFPGIENGNSCPSPFPPFRL